MKSTVKVQVKHVLHRENEYAWHPDQIADHRKVAPVLSWVLADVQTPAGDTVPNVVLPVTPTGIVASGFVVVGFRDGEDLGMRESARRVAVQWDGTYDQQTGQ